MIDPPNFQLEWGVSHLLTMHILNLQKNSRRDGGWPSFDHAHAESKKIPRDRGVGHLLTMHMLNLQKKNSRKDGGLAIF